MADKKINMSDDEILDGLRGDLSSAQSIQDDLAYQRESYYRGFRGDLYGNERVGWSQYVSPIIWTNHQSRMSALMDIFSQEFFILKSSDADRANKFQKLIRYQMFRKQDGNKRLYDFLYDAGLYHYAVFKVYHKEDYDIEQEKYESLTPDQMMQLAQEPNIKITKYTETESEPDPMTGQTSVMYENVKVARKIINYSGPCFETLAPWEFGYSPDCKLTEWGGIDGRLVYHGPFKLTLNEIRKRERAGIYRKGTYDKCLDLGNSGEQKGYDQIAVEFDVDGLSSQTTEPEDPIDELSKELHVKECYCKFDIDNDGLLEPCICVIIEDEVVAQLEENPYKKPCFRIGGMLPEPHKITGIAPPSKLENDQKVMTNLIRFTQDQAAMSTYRNPITSDVRMQQMLQTRKPFDVILGDPSKIGEVPVQTADAFILKAIELLKGDVEESSGDTRYNQGSDGESLNKTATGVSLISQNSARRLRMSAKLLGNGAITGVIRDFIFINQLWRSDDPIRLLGTDIEINKEDLDGEYDIEIDIGVSPAEKQQIAQQYELLAQFATQVGIPMGIMLPDHLVKIQKRKYGVFNTNIDDLMLTDEQYQQEKQKREQSKPKEDWREFVQIDKLYPSLARTEQMQILAKLEIQPDQQAQVAGIPQAKDVLAAQSKKSDPQAEQQKLIIEGQKAKMDMGMAQQKHQMDMASKQADLISKVITNRMQKGNNGNQSGTN